MPWAQEGERWRDDVGEGVELPTAHSSHGRVGTRRSSIAVRRSRIGVRILKIRRRLNVVGVRGEAVLALHQQKMIGANPPLIVMVVGDREMPLSVRCGFAGLSMGGNEGKLSNVRNISVAQYGLSSGQKTFFWVTQHRLTILFLFSVNV